jgi:flavin reductase (DIM6/NTAB) family NADH-FMN oxidoreductase RutF
MFEYVSDPRERVTVDPAEIGAGAMYHLMNAAIAPRPVAWVSTLSAAGVANVAPHSYTTVFSTNPPVIGFVSVGRKDSLNNVEVTGEFVVNIAGQDLLERLNLTAANMPPDEDEFTWAGLSRVRSDCVKPPRVGEAPVSFETTLHAIVPIGNCWLVLGQVLRVHVATSVWRDGRIDPALLDPILRLAGSQFARLGPLIELRRPTWDDVLAGTVAQLDPEEPTRG